MTSSLGSGPSSVGAETSSPPRHGFRTLLRLLEFWIEVLERQCDLKGARLEAALELRGVHYLTLGEQEVQVNDWVRTVSTVRGSYMRYRIYLILFKPCPQDSMLKLHIFRND